MNEQMTTNAQPVYVINQSQSVPQIYSVGTFFLLTFFLGALGVGQFYVGRPGKAFAYILTIGGFLGLLPIIDLFRARKVVDAANKRAAMS